MKLSHLFVGPLTALLAWYVPSASAQPLTASVGTDVPGHSIVDAQGMFPSDPSAPIFRGGTNPLVPITRSTGEQLTWGEFNQVDGQIQISPRPGGGTDVDLEVEGLIPGEFYTVWAGFWEAPGFPTGPRIAFGAVSEAGDGSDNFMVADANGNISLDLVQREGPMTIHGSAPSFAALSPAFDSNGDPRPHTGYGVGIAYHFGDFPDPPYLTPGPPATWALQATAFFAPVPEPSAVVHCIVAAATCAVFGLRRRGS